MEEGRLETPAPVPAWLLERLAAPPAPREQAAAAVPRSSGAISEGERNSSLASMAGAMRRRGMGQDAIEAALVKENHARCVPPLAPSEIRAIARSISQYPPAPGGRQEPNAWEPPLPFQGQQLPDFPTDALAGWVRDFVQGESDSTQTPPDLAAMLILAAVSCACQKKAAVHVRSGWTEPLNTYSVTVLPPGSRKTRVFSAIEEPLRDHEESLAKGAAENVAEAETRYRILHGKLQKAQAKAANADGAEAESLTQTATRLAQELASSSVPMLPRLVADDVTPERLATMLKEQDGRMAVLSAEGGIFDLMAGRYSKDGSPNFEVFLKGHAGDTLRVDRVGRPPEYVRSPALTIGLAVQPEVLSGLIRKQGFRGRGLLGRFIYSLPPNLLGRRRIGPPAMAQHVRAAFSRRMRALLDLPFEQDAEGNPVTQLLQLSSDAAERARAFEARVEPMLAEFGVLGHMTDWGGKLVGAVMRIAGLLHMIDHAGEGSPWAAQIQPGCVDRAIRIGEYLIPHARAAYASMGADPVTEDAKRVLAWVRKQGLASFSKRDLFQGLKGYFKRVAQIEPVLALLQEHGYIRQQAAESRSGAGRKPSPVYEVNPLWPPNSENCGNIEEPDTPFTAGVETGGNGNSEDCGDVSKKIHFKINPSFKNNVLGQVPEPHNSQNPQNDGELFNAAERDLIQGLSSESVDGLSKVKQAFPGSRVVQVRPPEPPDGASPKGGGNP